MSIVELNKLKNLNKEVENYVNNIFNVKNHPYCINSANRNGLLSLASKHEVKVQNMSEYLTDMFKNADWVMSNGSIINTLTNREEYKPTEGYGIRPNDSAVLIGSISHIHLYRYDPFTKSILYGKGIVVNAHNIVLLNFVG